MWTRSLGRIGEAETRQGVGFSQGWPQAIAQRHAAQRSALDGFPGPDVGSVQFSAPKALH